MTGASLANGPTVTTGAKVAWFLSPSSYNANYAWSLTTGGYVNSIRVSATPQLSPVLYLDSDLIVDTSKTGTSTDYYTLSQ